MQFFQWMATNWTAVAAWIGGLYTLYKLGSIVTAVIGLFTSISNRFKDAETTLTLLATNHLPHLQAELQNLNVKQENTHNVLEEIRDELRSRPLERKRHDE